MDNSINFKGAFLIHKPTQTLRNSIMPLLGKKKQVIENVTSDNGVLYVVRDKFDKGIADMLTKAEDVKFEYYPKLNTKSGFDDEKPADAARILNIAKKNMISTQAMLKNFFRPKVKKPIDIVKLQAGNLKTVQNAAFIDITGSCYRTNIDHQSGICSVYTMVKNPKDGKKNIRHSLITITPPDKLGISYARITPVSPDECVRRLAIKNGEVIFEYKQPGSEIFIKNEAAAKKHYIDIMEKYKTDLAASKAQ